MLLGVLGWPLAAAARRVAREAITECLMTLRLPAGRVLHLGRNLEAPYPESLGVLADRDTIASLERFHCDARGVHDCGAKDWAALDERLHFIAHLFRAFQEDPVFGSAPFTPEQVAIFAAGRIPDGDL
jgi:hypothetical protein